MKFLDRPNYEELERRYFDRITKIAIFFLDGRVDFLLVRDDFFDIFIRFKWGVLPYLHVIS